MELRKPGNNSCTRKVGLALILVIGLVAGVSAGSSDPVSASATLVAGGGNDASAIPVGTVTVTDDGDALHILYTITNVGWVLTGIHCDAAAAIDGIPQANGNPIPGKFSCKQEFKPGVTEATCTIPLAEIRGAQQAVTSFTVAAHAEVKWTARGGGKESAWAAGSPFSGKNWATYFTYDPDLDDDGLWNSEESTLGTDPYDSDTDDDGLLDGGEVKTYDTDPLKADTDADGLLDGEEVHTYATDPVKADTDGDGLNDGEEVKTYGTNPLKADTDNDGLTDNDEVKTHHTNPLNGDTDGDGLRDGDEVGTYHTNPCDADSDDDGLTDGDEVNESGTNPLKADTDNDGFTDLQELGSVHGNVTEAGNPLAGAQVELFYQMEHPGNIVRFHLKSKTTGTDGRFYFSKSEIESSFPSWIPLPEKPWKFFLIVRKAGYLDVYKYDTGETPKLFTSFWDTGPIPMTQLPPRVSLTEGRFVVRYYPPQTSCANIAMDKMQEYYPQVVELFATEPERSTTTFTFNTLLDQRGIDWGGSGEGISTVCYPWTDNIDDPEILAMWNEAVPHELAHHVLSGPEYMPSWATEGFAQYATKTINNDIDCSGPFVPIADLQGKNTPQYDSAACAFYLLEQQKPGFVQRLIDRTETQNTLCNAKSGYFIKTTMSSVFGSDLTNYFVTNFGFDAATLNEQNICV